MNCLNIVVFYDNYQEVAKYMKECLLNSSNVDIAVVVNSDKEKKVNELLNDISEHRSRIKLYDFGKNVGYLNSLLKIIKNENIENYKYYILSNTDIKYETSLFYEKLVKKTYDPDVGCIAPSVYSINTDTFANPHYKTRTSKNKLRMLSFIFSFPLIGRLYLKMSDIKSRNRNSKAEEESCYVYSPHGCFMIFTKDFIRCVKGYIYGTTLYSEEACVGELLLKNEKTCYFDKTLRVHHLESTVTGKIDYKKRFKYWKDSIDYILKEFY